jgi:hypothetical protein
MLICQCIARVPYSNSPMILLLRYSYLSKARMIDERLFTRF